jgi:DNA-3-methyladenine glycosylase I
VSAVALGDDGVARCPWGALPALRDYHDTEWGVPVRGETAFFERLCLEGFQAGLSWLTILNKRERYREVFHGFDVDRVAAFTDDDVARLMADPGIVRNRAKIEAARRNARATVDLRADGGLEAFVERFAPETTPAPADTTELPGSSAESLALSKALKKRGFAFVGPTTMYALMEATGLVDTHLTGCFRRGVSGRWAA